MNCPEAPPCSFCATPVPPGTRVCLACEDSLWSRRSRLTGNALARWLKRRCYTPTDGAERLGCLASTVRTWAGAGRDQLPDWLGNALRRAWAEDREEA